MHVTSTHISNVFVACVVMRAHGSRRLLLNAGMWAEMICERASVKSVRFTGQDLEGEAIKIYLLTVSIAIQFVAALQRLICSAHLG